MIDLLVHNYLEDIAMEWSLAAVWYNYNNGIQQGQSQREEESGGWGRGSSEEGREDIVAWNQNKTIGKLSNHDTLPLYIIIMVVPIMTLQAQTQYLTC